VDAEAEYAREVGSYLPVYIAPCALLPPFNTIHADDLSKWKGEANDPAWIRLVGRIAKLIDREGVSEAARAFANGDEQIRYDFARRYPDEPVARKIWSAAEANHRQHFQQRMLEAQAAAEARIDAERASQESRLKAAVPAFEIWLTDERRAMAQGPPPDPLDLIQKGPSGDEPRLRDEIVELHAALARSKAKENELDAAEASIARLSSDLATLKAREAVESPEHQRLRDEIVNLRSALDKAKTNEAKLDGPTPEPTGLSAQLAVPRIAGSRPLGVAAIIGFVVVGAGALVALYQVGKLRADLASAHDSLEAADKEQTEERLRADSLAKLLEGARSQASSLEMQLAAEAAKHGTQSPPAPDKPSWFVVVGSDPIPIMSRDSAEILIEDFGKHCQNYKSLSQIIASDEFGLEYGKWTVALGPYRAKSDVDRALFEIRNNCNFYAEPYTR
jgi:hypothetical protein